MSPLRELSLSVAPTRVGIELDQAKIETNLTLRCCKIQKNNKFCN